MNFRYYKMLSINNSTINRSIGYQTNYLVVTKNTQIKVNKQSFKTKQTKTKKTCVEIGKDL